MEFPNHTTEATMKRIRAYLEEYFSFLLWALFNDLRSKNVALPYLLALMTLLVIIKKVFVGTVLLHDISNGVLVEWVVVGGLFITALAFVIRDHWLYFVKKERAVAFYIG
jgi:pheromone shutdown protein TraB